MNRGNSGVLASNTFEATRVLVRKPVLKKRWVRQAGFEVEQELRIFVVRRSSSFKGDKKGGGEGENEERKVSS